MWIKKNCLIQLVIWKQQIGNLYQRLGELKQQLAEILEENHYLKLENEHLRRRLDLTTEKEKKEDHTKKGTNPRTTSSDKVIDVGKAMITLLDFIKRVFIFVIFILEAYGRKAIVYFAFPSLIRNKHEEADSNQPLFSYIRWEGFFMVYFKR